MTIAEVKELYEGKYSNVEIYKPCSNGKYYPNHFHTDNCVGLGEGSPHGDYTEDMEVELYELMDQDEYNNTLMANFDTYADFEDWYGDKNAKVLCMMIK